MVDANLGSAGQAGSSNNGPDAGQPSIEQLQAEVTRITSNNENLEKKLGEQGSELGEFRSFFNNISPVLEKLDASPELVQAIVDGKIDGDIAKAALENKLTIGEANLITEAHDKIKKDMGKDYIQASPEEISKLIEKEVGKATQAMNQKMQDAEELRSFESTVNDFINRTPDFSDYAQEIDKWMEKHDDISDISVAYYAVKGQMSEKEANKKAIQDAAEHAKSMALAAGGGSSRANYVPAGNSLVDDLIASRSNPNVF